MKLECKSLLAQFIEREYKYLLLKFNQERKLEFCEGDPDYFGLDDQQIIHQTAEDVLPFLVGVDITSSFKLHYIEFIDGIVCNVYVYPDESGFHVILVDTGFMHDLQQEVQQQANENSILQYRLQQMDARLQKINQRLEKANRAKSEFITTASHELKTPLSSILGYAELIQNKAVPTDEIRSAADTILSNGNYLLSLLDNLLEQGRIEYHETTINRHAIGLAGLLDDIVNIIQPLARKKSLELDTDLRNKEDIVLLLDEQHIRQILVNLLTNAIKFTEQGRVVLSVSYNDESVTFSVQDSGVGIRESELKNIMEPFRRADTIAAIEGVGLGLSVSKKLIHLMGGDMDIQSEVGVGTTVTFSLPANQATDNIDTSVVTSKPKPSVLLIDDDEDLNNLFSHILDSEGYSVFSVNSADAAVAANNQYQPELILLDHNLNGEDGVELAKQLIATGFAGKIIMMTAASDQNLVDRAIAAGCIDFLKKPVRQQHLLEILNLHGY